MRFIPTKVHAVVDYITGALLVVVPLFYLEHGSAAIWVPVILGAVALLQALATNYEFSLTNAIPMSGHLIMDATSGIILAASPWLFEFSDRVWIPHLVVGLMEIGMALTTKLHRSEPARDAHPPRPKQATAS